MDTEPGGGGGGGESGPKESWSEEDDFLPFLLTPEQRLLKRNIPFFHLPELETLPNVENVKPRVDTHNTRYRRSKSAPPRRIHTQREDYSHVTGKVDTGLTGHAHWWKREGQNDGPGEGGGATRRTLTKRVTVSGAVPIDTSAAVRKVARRRPFSAGLTSTAATVKTSSLPNFCHVRPKVCTRENVHYQPRGSGVRVERHSIPKYAENATPKVGVWDNINHTPRGGAVKYQTYAVDHFRQGARSKLDRTDPNPAHRMRRSLDDLTIHKGMRWNPRFNPDLKEGMFGAMRFSRNGMSKVPKSATIHSFTSLHSKSPPPNIKHTSSSSKHITEREESNQDSLETRELHAPNAVSSSSHVNTNTAAESGPTNLNEVAIDPEHSSPGSQPNTDAFSAEDIEEESLHGQTKSSDIVDVEVASSETETTVYLVHLLSSLQSRRRSASEGMMKMPSIEETESEETDSISEYDGSSSEELEAVPEPVTSYTLPHPIPSLAVYDENDSLVETVVRRSSLASSTESMTHDDANRGHTSNSTSTDKGQISADPDTLSNGELERSSV